MVVPAVVVALPAQVPGPVPVDLPAGGGGPRPVRAQAVPPPPEEEPHRGPGVVGLSLRQEPGCHDGIVLAVDSFAFLGIAMTAAGHPSDSGWEQTDDVVQFRGRRMCCTGNRCS